jgi:hypothetical protein
MRFTLPTALRVKLRITLRFPAFGSITADKGAARPHYGYWVGNAARLAAGTFIAKDTR